MKWKQNGNKWIKKTETNWKQNAKKECKRENQEWKPQKAKMKNNRKYKIRANIKAKCKY